MNIYFHIEYHTVFGEELVLNIVRLVIGHVHADFPAQVFLLDGHYVQGNFNTLVLHITNILQQIVGQVGQASHGNVVQQVVGDALVDVNATIDAVVPETEVETDVISCGLLPLDLSGVALRSDRNDDVVAKPVVRTTHVGVVGRNRRIVTLTDVLLTGDTIAQTELSQGRGWMMVSASASCVYQSGCSFTQG